MFSFTELGLAPSLLGVIVGQAAIVLIACSILLGVVKDLYEVMEVSVGVPGERKRKRLRSVLAGGCADRLRVFIRLFSYALPLAYIFIGFLVLLVQKAPVVTIDGKALRIAIVRSPFPQWDFAMQFDLQTVYSLELIFHFIVVVTVAIILFWTVGVRREASKQRLREQGP